MKVKTAATVQVNAEIPATLAKRVKLDAVQNNTTLNAFFAQALDRFLKLPPSARRTFLAASPKRTGRRLAVEVAS